MGCGRLSNGSRRYPVPNPQVMCVLFYMAKSIYVEIWLRIVRRENYPWISSWVLNEITGVLEEEAKWWWWQKKQKAMWQWKQDATQLALKMEKSVMSQGKQAASRNGKKVKETDSPSRVSWRNQPCWHLDFSLMKLISDFWPPEVQEKKKNSEFPWWRSRNKSI